MKDELEDFIHHNRNGFNRENPDPAVLNRILAQMEQKGRKPARGRVIPFRALYWAAACLILATAAIIFQPWQKKLSPVQVVKNKPLITPQQPDSAASFARNKPARRKSLEAVDNDLSARKETLSAKLTERRSRPNKLVWLTSLNNMESPASRISAISEAFEHKGAGNDVIDALVHTLNKDPNVNVRLAALDGLARYYREAYVRKQLIASLKQQQDPVVQIALIELLTRIRDSAVLTELNRIINDENSMKAVKDCAYSGLFRLQSS